jgi:hypothetical protein
MQTNYANQQRAFVSQDKPARHKQGRFTIFGGQMQIRASLQ